MAHRFGSKYDAQVAARRRKRRRVLAVVVPVVAVAAVIWFAVGRDYVAGSKVDGYFGWGLIGVSKDERTITVVREGNICGFGAGAPEVEQTRREVVLTLPRIVSTRGGDYACVGGSFPEYVRVRLSSPLTLKRTLRQPPNGYLLENAVSLARRAPKDQLAAAGN